MSEPTPLPWWRTRSGIALCGFLFVAGFFLLTEHTAHVLGVLPYLLLAACPLMHFLHHGHGHGAGEHGAANDRQHPDGTHGQSGSSRS